MTQSRLHRVTIGKKDVDSRLDRTLADKVPALSRTRIKRLIQTGLVEVNTKTVTDPAYRLSIQEKITITVPAPKKAEPQPQSIPLKIIYEDDDLIVIDKPPGLVVHPAPGNPDQTLVNALLAHCGESIAGVGGVRRPGIVHRIDKGTSGLLVAAKNDGAHQHLSTLFSTHQIERAYKAIVSGVPNLVQGKITENIGRNPKNRKKMAVVLTGGKTARTNYCVQRILGDQIASLVICHLTTGRTHQIRVHMASIGHPVLADPIYSRVSAVTARMPSDIRCVVRGFPRHALHAYKLGFSHPTTGKRKIFESELPDDMAALLEGLARKN